MKCLSFSFRKKDTLPVLLSYFYLEGARYFLRRRSSSRDYSVNPVRITMTKTTGNHFTYNLKKEKQRNRVLNILYIVTGTNFFLSSNYKYTHESFDDLLFVWMRWKPSANKFHRTLLIFVWINLFPREFNFWSRLTRTTWSLTCTTRSIDLKFSNLTASKLFCLMSYNFMRKLVTLLHNEYRWRGSFEKEDKLRI